MVKASARVAAKKGKTVYPDITPKRFIEVWQSAESAAEAAEKLGMPQAIASARASNYRKMGIHLKVMRKKKKGSLDVAALNRLVEQINSAIGRDGNGDGDSSGRDDVCLSEESTAEVVRQVLEKRKK